MINYFASIGFSEQEINAARKRGIFSVSDLIIEILIFAGLYPVAYRFNRQHLNNVVYTMKNEFEGLPDDKIPRQVVCLL